MDSKFAGRVVEEFGKTFLPAFFGDPPREIIAITRKDRNNPDKKTALYIRKGKDGLAEAWFPDRGGWIGVPRKLGQGYLTPEEVIFEATGRFQDLAILVVSLLGGQVIVESLDSLISTRSVDASERLKILAAPFAGTLLAVLDLLGDTLPVVELFQDWIPGGVVLGGDHDLIRYFTEKQRSTTAEFRENSSSARGIVGDELPLKERMHGLLSNAKDFVIHNLELGASAVIFAAAALHKRNIDARPEAKTLQEKVSMVKKKALYHSLQVVAWTLLGFDVFARAVHSICQAHKSPNKEEDLLSAATRSHNNDDLDKGVPGGVPFAGSSHVVQVLGNCRYLYNLARENFARNEGQRGI